MLALEKIKASCNEKTTDTKKSALTAYLFDQISSTMDLASAIQQGQEILEPHQSIELNVPAHELQGLTAVLARGQTQGRGRQGRSWTSTENQGLYATVCWNPQAKLNTLPGLSIVVGLALQQALKSFNLKVSLKWPNDLVVFEENQTQLVWKKLGGILIESTLNAEVCSSMRLGFGINLQPVEIAPPAQPISLSELGFYQQQACDENILFVTCLFEIIENLNLLLNTGFAPFQERFMRDSNLCGKKLSRNHKVYLVEGIDSQGALIVNDPQTQEKSLLHSGEIEL
ncbi:biotin--[acetyl-CoA-carboxylase] ligase [bacterium]|nr:biotin--[acetyl-CoA-carboxylase] ligase [bacterium]